MTFWVMQPARAKAERRGVAALMDRSPWLTSVVWGIDEEARLTANFVVRHADEDFPLVMTYPEYFPDVPPVVVPVDRRRLSAHQYPAGDLCLEWRADNWSSDVTGVDMITSAYDLIAGERSGEDAPRVPSAHDVPLGQAVRNEVLRLVVDKEVLGQLRSHPGMSRTPVWLRMRFAAGCIVTFIEFPEDPDALDPSGRNHLDGTWSRRCDAVRIATDFTLRPDCTIEILASFVRSLGHDELADKVSSDAGGVYLIVVSDTDVTLLLIDGAGGARTITRDVTIVIPEEGDRRNHATNEVLESRAVGIVGCGSVGSKIAVSLARAGVGRFVLVDPDIMLPINLQRHDLDGRFIGTHKVDGLRQRLQDVSGKATVVARRVTLGGQESAETLASVLDDLAGCDLVIEATADPQVFNYCASLARTRSVAMLWVEVLAGGIGGLFARSRPEVDPPPQEARRQILAWTEARGVPAPTTSDIPYAAGEGAVLVADDGDVSTIAAHATRLAIDTLVRPETSLFPYSAYFVGLTRSWIFDAPFDTWPVEYRMEGTWGAATDPERAAHASDLIRDLVTSKSDAAPPTE
ncbi:ThiF family adenylyltransferase [Aureimonas phyllosphaerae]|uniref:ThiF family adenylyltransferase n=1 Tax=Aureimonas phyllosphaerae TaxID=1166078 RepID=UPI003A5C2173